MNPAQEGAHDMETVNKLLGLLDEAQNVARTFALQVAATQGRDRVDSLGGRVAELERRLQEADRDLEGLSKLAVGYEMQAARLMSLYVATYQLHSTLDPSQVRIAIADVATNVLGAEAFALLLEDKATSSYIITFSQGLEGNEGSSFAGERYTGGDPIVDATLADGFMRVETMEGAEALAAIPLRVNEQNLGALVILKLLGHRPPLGEADREILDLLAAHAASALLAAEAYSRTLRKLQTIEELVKMSRKR